MKQTTEQKLQHARAKIRQWESKVRRAANKLAAYRAVETRLMRKQAAEIQQLTAPKGRQFDLAQS